MKAAPPRTSVESSRDPELLRTAIFAPELATSRGIKCKVALFTVTGNLDRGEDDEQGRVTLRAPLGGAQRSIRLYLSDEQYHAAGEANMERRTVFVRGELGRTSGRMWEFKRVQDFGSVEDLAIEELERLYPATGRVPSNPQISD